MPATYSVEITPAAEFDVEEIWTYIASDSRELAAAFILRLEEQIETLEQFPLLPADPRKPTARNFLSSSPLRSLSHSLSHCRNQDRHPEDHPRLPPPSFVIFREGGGEVGNQEMKEPAQDEITSTPSSGNIFEDLGLPDAECGFRSMSATHSDSSRPPIPIEGGHLFRFKSATHSV